MWKMMEEGGRMWVLNVCAACWSYDVENSVELVSIFSYIDIM